MCGYSWRRPVQGGRRPRWCGDACKQRAYRDRLRSSAWSSAAAGGDAWSWWEDLLGGGGGTGWAGTPFGSWSSQDTAAARATVYRLAGLADDGAVALKRAYRRAARRTHPDVADGDLEDFKVLEAAVDLLKRVGAFA